MCLSILTTKRVAEHASQRRCISHQRSRAFSATHFTDENAQLLGFTGAPALSGGGARRAALGEWGGRVDDAEGVPGVLAAVRNGDVDPLERAPAVRQMGALGVDPLEARAVDGLAC